MLGLAQYHSIHYPLHHVQQRRRIRSHPVRTAGRSRSRKHFLLHCRADGSDTANQTKTQRIMESISTTSEVGGAGGAYSYNALKRLDNLWSSMCNTPTDNKEKSDVVFLFPDSSSTTFPKNSTICTFDVLVCGGTLGIFLATSLASKGLRVGIVERNQLRGREQEWNISMKELMELVHARVLSKDDIEQAIVANFNPNRCVFEGKGEILVEDILNLGISPIILLEKMKQQFISYGGVIYEGTSLSSICIYDDAAIVKLSDGSALSAQLIVDAMGNFSPIVQQIRSGIKPDGVCLVVGSCSRGFKENSTSDVIFTSSSVKRICNFEMQYFWEAFPAGSGSSDRTTYLFTYVEAQPGCPKLEDLLEDYWNLMPAYQGINLEELEILRVIYGIFPTYRDRYTVLLAISIAVISLITVIHYLIFNYMI